MDRGDYYASQAHTAQSTAAAIALIWANLDPTNLDAQWTGMRLVLAGIITDQQLAAALAATQFLDANLAAANLTPKPIAKLAPKAFAGVAADGRPLATLLDLSLIDVKVRIAQGLRPAAALQSGLYRAQRFGHTETQDAGRIALQAGMTLEPKVKGYVRHVRSPACDRCLVLAGRFYKYSAGFARHPHCDCVNVPVLISNPDTPSPEAMFAAMTTAQQDASFGAAAAEAIRAGADINQVVNAKRGMSEPGADTTTEGTTKRGAAGKLLAGKARATPAALLRQHGADRQAFAAALVSHGYARR